MLNASNRRMIDQAASLLGKSNFERVFGFSPDQQFNLVDPELMRSQAPGRKKQVPKTAVSRVTRPSSAAHVVTLKHLAAALPTSGIVKSGLNSLNYLWSLDHQAPEEGSASASSV
jgi:hypothetical protein